VNINSPKLYKTTPINAKSWDKIENFNRTDTVNLHKNDKIWNSLLDLSSISEGTKFANEN
jgi:hypothetical protein